MNLHGDIGIQHYFKVAIPSEHIIYCTHRAHGVACKAVTDYAVSLCGTYMPGYESFPFDGIPPC